MNKVIPLTKNHKDYEDVSMRTIAVILSLIISTTSFAAKEWPEPEDSGNCSGSDMCHGKGDYAIQKGWIGFFGKGRTDETFKIRAPSVLLMGLWGLSSAFRI